jgi:uncharacterized protein involved in outer membrane biogenesis
MKTVFKFLGFTTTLLVILAVAAVVYIGWLFDPNDYKDYLEATVETRTGRDFAIEDDLSLSFLPALGVEAGGITLGNATGFGDEPLARAERAVLRVKLLPLLSGRIELGNFEIDGLRLNLASDAEGFGNWEDLLAGTGETQVATSPAPGGDSFLDDLAVEGIEITDGLLFWREDTTEVRYIVSEMNIETGPVLIGQPVRTDMSFEIVGVEPAFTAQLTTSGTALINPSSSLYLAEDLSVGFYLEDGRHEERAAGRIESTISLNTDQMLLTLGESQVEASLREPPLGPASLQIGATWTGGEVNLRSGDVTVTGLNTNTNGIRASWEISGSDLLGAPAFSGQVDVAGEPLRAVIDLAGLPIDDTRDADTLGSFDFNTVFTARPRERAVTLSDLAITALGLEMSGDFTIDANGDGSGQVSVPRFDPRELLALFSPEFFRGVRVEEVDAIAFAATFDLDGERQQAIVSDVSAALNDVALAGSFDYFRAERRVEGTIETSDINPVLIEQMLPDFLPPALPPERLGTLRLTSGFAFDTVTDELSLTDFDADGIGLHATGHLAVSELLAEAPRWTGELHIDRFNPRDLFARFDVLPQRNTDPSVFGNAVVDTRLDITTERGYFEGIQLQLDDSTITGSISVDNFGSPEYAFDLDIDRLDVDRYLPPETDALPATPASGERVIELPTEAMHALAMNGAVSVGSLRIGGLDLESVTTELAVGDGLGIIDSARADLYGGDFEGGVQFDARGGVPELSLNGTVVSLQLDPLLGAIRDESNLTGTGNFEISLSGIGSTFGDVLASTAGRVDFSLRDGIVRGVNIGHGLCDVYNTIQKAPRPMETNDRFTEFELLRGSAVVTDGIARTSDLQASTSFMNVNGRGQLDLTNQDVNFDLVATLTNGIEIDRCETMDPLVGDSIPLRLTGNLSAPVVRPDFQEIIRNRARESLQERFQERLGEELQDLLSN